MIKKILSLFLVSSALFVFAATGSYAERPTFAVGASLAYGGYTASGQENEGAGTHGIAQKGVTVVCAAGGAGGMEDHSEIG